MIFKEQRLDQDIIALKIRSKSPNKSFEIPSNSLDIAQAYRWLER